MGLVIKKTFNKLLPNCSSDIVLDYLHKFRSFIDQSYGMSFQCWSHDRSLAMQRPSEGNITIEEVINEYKYSIDRNKCFYTFQCILINEMCKQVWSINLYPTKIPHIDWRLIQYHEKQKLETNLDVFIRALLHNEFASIIVDHLTGVLIGEKTDVYIVYKINNIHILKKDYDRIPSSGDHKSKINTLIDKARIVLSPKHEIVELAREQNLEKNFVKLCDSEILAYFGSNYLSDLLGELHISLKQWLVV